MGEVEIGGYAQYTIQLYDYRKLLATSAKDVNPGKRLTLKLLYTVFSNAELAQMNATGRTTGQAAYPKLNPVGLKALFTQAKMQFPAFNELVTDPSSATIKS